MTGQLRWSPHWRPIYEGELLLITAGADELYAIEDVPPAVAREVVALAEAPQVRRETLSPPAAAIVEELWTAGIIEPAGLDGARCVALRFVGVPHDTLGERLAGALGARGLVVGTPDEAGLLVLLRTNGRLRDLLGEGYPQRTTPHLLVDLAPD